LSLGGVGVVLLRNTRKVVDARTGKVTEVPALHAAGDGGKGHNDAGEEFVPTVPLLVDMAAPLRECFRADVLNEELLKIRRALYFDLGVPFPGIQLRFNDKLPPETYNILLSEVPVSQGKLRPGFLLVRENPQNLEALQIAFETDKKFLPNI